ncbi:hypothetical protein PPYR_12472 [Photinus pyralis]|uniref:Uncharacterized protein n=3 Tax=Photinus pyralis TaxID=7054 RepID=A0A5N4AE78_PHOPY|nr:uncharacterized protein LOC116175857 [Photinus pyralis]XP_031350059.1 uncharacterized protein LOC116175857 [Photinus pyralis]XP_031350060.1 uncharacterized protein LOC116175857 [Photinus pyralis]KAB0795633.1 hypothetical protein PPYR_12472 [Photinus pyralis]
MKLGAHGKRFGCSLENILFVKEELHGLASLLHMKCSMCNETFKIHTSDDTVNKDAVLAMMSIGSGFCHLEQVTSSLDIPCMSARMYDSVHDEVSDACDIASLKAMREAAEEEKEIALRNKNVDKNGIPLITVVADGTWSKRSYHTNFNSLSGAAAIIGFQTKKVLFLGVRNKFCTICKISETAGNTPNAHKCYKNWSGSSAAMEADIVAEGFSRSLEMYGLIYNKLIADGDSSCYKKILDTHPYETTVVEKIECKNHLLRNFSKKIRELIKDTLAGPLILRKKIKQNQLRLRWAVCKAISFRKTEVNPFNEKVGNLKKDIRNCISHVFGEHKDCENLQYFCKESYIPNGSTVSDLKQTDLYDKLESFTNVLVRHASSLIYDVDNNTVEQFNSIIAKYIGGKRINYSKKRSYQSRCAAAVISHNTKRPIYTIKKYLDGGRQPGKYAVRSELIKIRRNERRRPKPKKKKQKENRTEGHLNKHYGDNCEKPDMNREEYNSAKDAYLKNLKKTQTEIRDIERATQTQECNLWYLERRKRLTASKFGDVCRRRDYTSCRVQVNSIIYPQQFFSNACEYGQKNEKIAKVAVEAIIGTTIEPCGLFIDPIFPFLAASPDGLIGDRGLLEIKCPWSARNMTPEEAIRNNKILFWSKEEINRKHKWYYQVQGQLHIADRQYCVFAVWTPLGVKIETIFKNDEFWTSEMEGKLCSFYMDCLLPELVDPRKTRNMEIRDPESILRAIENKKRKRDA